MDRLRIIVSGMVGQSPVGGMSFHYFQYLIGLHLLGHDVYYHEDTWSWPYDVESNSFTNDPSFSVQFVGGFFERYAPELRNRWHYCHLHRDSFGMSSSRFGEVASTADIFLNVSGASFFPEELSAHCVRVFVDTDPGVNQILLATRPSWAENVDRWSADVLDHDVHFSYGELIGSENCSIPEVGIDWLPTRQPVVESLWDLEGSDLSSPITTVMTWNVFKGTLRYNDVEYSGKGPEFEPYSTLPQQVPFRFRVAVGGTEVPKNLLASHGWDVWNGPQATKTPALYQRFISDSAAEFSVAKQVYVAMNSGWFSDRSAAYLAAGRPVILQDTGFSNHLPTGQGLVAFRTPEAALAGIDDVMNNYEAHSDAAREIGRGYFRADDVLTRLLTQSGGG